MAPAGRPATRRGEARNERLSPAHPRGGRAGVRRARLRSGQGAGIARDCGALDGDDLRHLPRQGRAVRARSSRSAVRSCCAWRASVAARDLPPARGAARADRGLHRLLRRPSRRSCACTSLGRLVGARARDGHARAVGYWQEIHALQADIFRRGVAAGEFVDEDPGYLAEALQRHGSGAAGRLGRGRHARRPGHPRAPAARHRRAGPLSTAAGRQVSPHGRLSGRRPGPALARPRSRHLLPPRAARPDRGIGFSRCPATLLDALRGICVAWLGVSFGGPRSRRGLSTW